MSAIFRNGHRLRRQWRGFTLLEVLVALSIMSVIAVLGWRGLDGVIRLADRIRLVDDSTADWKGVFTQVDQDLRGVPVQRTGNMPGQTPVSPVIRMDTDGLTLLVSQQTDEVPARWVTLRWALQNGRVTRAVIPLADTGGAETPKPVASILEGPTARGLRMRFWYEGVGWTQTAEYGQAIPANQSPVPESTLLIPALRGTSLEGAANASPYNSPTGLEMSVWLDDNRIYTRVFRVGGAS